jgi:hypothetical protein
MYLFSNNNISNAGVTNVISQKGYIVNYRAISSALLIIALVIDLFIVISGISRKPYMTFEGVDPTSFASLVVLMQTIFGTALTSAFFKSWSWEDLASGRSYTDTPPNSIVQNKINRQKFLKYLIANGEQYESFLSKANYCYVRGKLSGSALPITNVTKDELAVCGMILIFMIDKGEFLNRAIWFDLHSGMITGCRIASGIQQVHIIGPDLELPKGVVIDRDDNPIVGNGSIAAINHDYESMSIMSELSKSSNSLISYYKP